MDKNTERYIGLMSGTSLDAIDAALFEFSSEGKLQLIESHSIPIPKDLRTDILTLCQTGSHHRDHVHQLGKTDTELGLLFAQACLELLEKTPYSADDIRAIGHHGQTIRHVPNANFPFTIQIGDPNIISTLTNITTVADFRRRDLALGGQAAPLAPGFHQFAFHHPHENRVIVNIGGIANLSFLPANLNEAVIGFDSGPGNTLLDQWCQQHLDTLYDHNGSFAASGEVNHDLLNLLCDDPYFSKPAPKSTGREYFNVNWLMQHEALINSMKPADVQASLSELTAWHIANAIIQIKQPITEAFVCGGGAFNLDLIKRLQQRLLPITVQSTSELGIDPQWVETACFAWLARQSLHGLPGNLPSVTGAKRPTVLGAIYPIVH